MSSAAILPLGYCVLLSHGKQRILLIYTALSRHYSSMGSMIMEEILELIVMFLARTIYGSEGRPRHPFWRNLIRFIAFGGALASVCNMLGLIGEIEFSIIIVIIWSICSLIVVCAEYYIGSKKVAYAAITVSVLWFLVVLITFDML